METTQQKISLGFTHQQFEPGVHICQIYSDDNERQEALVNYIVSGLQGKEKTACFTEKETPASLAEFFESKGISYKEKAHSGEFSLGKTGEVYFEDGKFEPERMLTLLREFYETSRDEHCQGARVIGEMVPDIQYISGGSRLLEYESKVSLLLRECPVTAVCQYDARAFDGATILDILKVHPYMIIRGSVVHNPFYIEPEEYLAKNNAK